jgi:hypothetical protein
VRSSPVGSLAQCIFGVRHAALSMLGDAESAALATQDFGSQVFGPGTFGLFSLNQTSRLKIQDQRLQRVFTTDKPKMIYDQ